MISTTFDGGVAWPPKPIVIGNSDLNSVTQFESWISEKFNGIPAVAFSSGREGIKATALCLKMEGFQRFSVPPFTSECVVHAIQSANQIVLTNLNRQHSDYVYHQYGHRFEQDLPPIMEDSVDTYFSFGQSPFLSNARFAIWSMRKLFGVQEGSVVWCVNESDKVKLQSIRENLQSWKDLDVINFYKSVSYVMKNWKLAYDDYSEIVVHLLQKHLNIIHSSMQSYYFETTLKGVIPTVLKLSNDADILTSKNFLRNTVLLKRRLVRSNLERNNSSLMLPIWQIRKDF